MAAFVVASEVRTYLDQTANTGSWSDATIGSNIRTASWNLQRWTGRQFEAQAGATKTFTTHGRASLVIPDLRTATSVTKDGGALTADSGYWLVPDRFGSGVYTGIQLRVYGTSSDGPWYLSDSRWWDKGLDIGGGGAGPSSIPNDLVIVGDWGWSDYPDPLLHATKVLAAFYTLRPASILANVRVTESGAVLAYRELPMEVQDFIASWSLGEQAVAVPG